jgi:hypothetical protein
MAKTFTTGFGPKGELIDKFELGDVMDDNAESHNDPYGEEGEEGLEEVHNEDENDEE